VSTEAQDLDKQKHLLREHAEKNRFFIDEYIEVAISSRKSKVERKIDELSGKLKNGDMLLVAELSRLGRNMFETLDIINALGEKGIKIVFVRQPELSTNGAHGKLLLAIYSYFAEAEREYISMRTRQGLAAAKANGKQLGRPEGSKNKNGSRCRQFFDMIKDNLAGGVPVRSIQKLINLQAKKPISYTALKHYIDNSELLSWTKEEGKNKEVEFEQLQEANV